MTPVILIPSRMASTRLPNKPLADIAGKPMIVQVYERAMEADIADVVVAADDERIADAVRAVGGKVVLTDPNHPSGSDRIFEALNQIDTDGRYDVVINVQGDLPTLDPALIRDSLAPLENAEVDISTLACRIDNDADEENPSVVKPVVAWDAEEKQGKALYFTRCPSPYGEGNLYHHIGLYAYRTDALKKFVSLPPSPLELREKLEQLRALEAGMHIAVVAVDTVPLGVDTEEQLMEARRQLS